MDTILVNLLVSTLCILFMKMSVEQKSFHCYKHGFVFASASSLIEMQNVLLLVHVAGMNTNGISVLLSPLYLYNIHFVISDLK